MTEGPPMAQASKLILSLCDYSGIWSQPYVDAGYSVVRIDLDHPAGEHQTAENVWTVGADLTRLEFSWKPWGILAAPPCTCFCRPAARHWFKQDFTGKTTRDVALFRVCLSECMKAEGWWALENPPGRHGELMPELGKPAWQFQPYEYGDQWGKQTYVWGTARKPPITDPIVPEPTRRTPNGRTQGRISFMSSSHKRMREQTPSGFAKAFAEANR
jgi:hypothetical protein